MIVSGIDSTYDQLINNILNTRGRFSCGDEYHECHHIIPKCMGGSDDEENLIDLFAREHFEAHKLLALENPDNEKLIYAWWAMSHLKDKNQKRVEISSEEYEEAKQQYGKIRSQKVIGENNPMFGISPKERMDENTYLQWKENIIKSTNSDEFKTQARDRNIGKKYPDDVNKKKGRSGPDHHLYGKHQSEETKQKLREANIGKKYSDEINAKKGKAGANNPSARAVEQYTKDGIFIKKWGYIKLASEALGIRSANISACCCGYRGRKTAGGFIWKYASIETGGELLCVL